MNQPSPTFWNRLTRIPWMIVGCTIALMLIGLTAIARGDELAGSGDYLTRQLVWIAISLPAMFLMTTISYRTLRWVSYPLFAINIVLLVLVYYMPMKNGAHRWIPLGFFNFQPSEVAKLTFIMALAQYLMHRENYRSMQGLLIPFAIALLPIGLILREPDLGTSLVFLPVLFAMLFSAGARPRHLILICCLGASLSPALWFGMSAEQKSRVVTLFMQKDSGPAPHGDGYHLHQSKQLLSLGGKVGSELSGIAVADSRAYHLPAGRTDFIFCLVGERWGLLGCMVTLGIYLLLFARGLFIATATREPFGRLLAVGIVTLLATQLIINTSMTVGLMPITGLTLPLMSYGGSSLLATSIALGLLMNIAMRPGYEVSSQPFQFDE